MITPVSSLSPELGKGSQRQSAASIVKATALFLFWGIIKVATDTPPAGLEPTTGCKEG